MFCNAHLGAVSAECQQLAPRGARGLRQPRVPSRQVRLGLPQGLLALRDAPARRKSSFIFIFIRS